MSIHRTHLWRNLFSLSLTPTRPLSLSRSLFMSSHLKRLLVLGHERELIVVPWLALKRVVQHRLHTGLRLGLDEPVYERLAHGFLTGKPGQCHGLLVPLVDAILGVDANNGSIGGVEESKQVGLLRELLCYVLPDADDAHRIASRVVSRRGA